MDFGWLSFSCSLPLKSILSGKEQEQIYWTTESGPRSTFREFVDSLFPHLLLVGSISSVLSLAQNGISCFCQKWLPFCSKVFWYGLPTGRWPWLLRSLWSWWWWWWYKWYFFVSSIDFILTQILLMMAKHSSIVWYKASFNYNEFISFSKKMDSLHVIHGHGVSE